MEESLRDLSQHLKEASSLLSTLVDSGQLCCPSSSNDGNQAAINSIKPGFNCSIEATSATIVNQPTSKRKKKDTSPVEKGI